MPGQELLVEQLCYGDAMPWDFCSTVGPAHEHSHVGFSPLAFADCPQGEEHTGAQVRGKLLPAVHNDGPWAGCSLQSLLHLGHQVQQGLG